MTPNLISAKECKIVFFRSLISVTKIYEMAKKDEIPHVKIGSRVLFDLDDLNEWYKSIKSKSSEKKGLRKII